MSETPTADNLNDNRHIERSEISQQDSSPAVQNDENSQPENQNPTVIASLNKV